MQKKRFLFIYILRGKSVVNEVFDIAFFSRHFKWNLIFRKNSTLQNRIEDKKRKNLQFNNFSLNASKLIFFSFFESFLHSIAPAFDWIACPLTHVIVCIMDHFWILILFLLLRFFFGAFTTQKNLKGFISFVWFILRRILIKLKKMI